MLFTPRIKTAIVYPSYIQRLYAIDPVNLIGLWPLNEGSGLVARDLSRQGNDGVHTAVTLNAFGIGDGNAGANYDGSTSYTDIYSAALNSDFNGTEGTAQIWFKVSGAGVWEDAGSRYLLRLLADGDNFVAILKHSDNNKLNLEYKAGGTVERRAVSSYSPTDWVSAVITWSKTAGADGEVKAYLDGVQQGATMTSLGTWVGNLDSANVLIGSATKTPTLLWSGELAHTALWKTALSAEQILEASKI